MAATSTVHDSNFAHPKIDESKISSCKLVAISGIARRITRLTQIQPSDYLAGLWRPLILNELLWNVNLEIPEESRSEGYHAPSWSWAFTNAPVGLGNNYHRLKEFSPAVEVVDAAVSLTSDNVFGQVVGGHLKLRGPLRKASCIRDSQTGALSVDIAGTLNRRALLLTKWDCIQARWPSEDNREFAQNPVYFMVFWGYLKYVDEDISRQGLIYRRAPEMASTDVLVSSGVGK